LLRVYPVGKKVADFPPTQDLSTPESAYAAINRALAGDDSNAVRSISAARTRARIPLRTGTRRELPQAAVDRWLQAHVVEVRVFRGVHAAVLARFPGKAGEGRIDVRSVNLEDGQWLNVGEDIARDLDAARVRFARSCGRHAEKRARRAPENPDALLEQCVDFVKQHGRAPKRFILDAVGAHEIVIMGEVHHRPRYWNFNCALIESPEFPKLAGTIYMELPSHGQPLVDTFLSAQTLDATPVIDMLRDMMILGWPDRAMLDFFLTAWHVNQRLPAAERLRIVLVDMPRPWRDIRTRADWRKYECDRDRLMAENILRDRRAPDRRDQRHTLFIVGMGHAMLNLKYLDRTTPMQSAGRRLRQALGADHVHAILPHVPRMTNVGRVHGRLCRGLFDATFAAVGNKPTAFSLHASPFGEQPFDAMPDRPAYGTFADGYDSYLYLGPLEDEVFSALIPGFYTDAFVQELDRRHRVMQNRGVVEVYGLPALDARSFFAFMSRSWGQPRRTWKRGLGPIDAWRRGDE